MTNDTTPIPAPEGVASQVPEGVARSLALLRFQAVADLVAQLRSQEPADRTTTANILEELNQERAALAADLAAQKARAGAAEREREIYHEAAKRHRDEVQRLLLDVIPAAEAKVAQLVEVLTWTDMELAKLSGLWHDVSPRKQIRAAIAEAGQ